MAGSRPLFLRVLLMLGCAWLSAAAAPRLHLAGDSTMADKERNTPNPEYGWGEVLPRLMKDPTVVVNHAKNGRSTRSFRGEGLWAQLLGQLQPGDWVIIQFGHNDQKADAARHTLPRDGYMENLRRFLFEVREKGAHPVLATPVARRKWSDAGELVDTHGDYPDAMRVVARNEHVPLLELTELTMALERELGVEGSKRLHLWIPDGVYARKKGPWADDTHYSEYGAERVAALAAQEIRRLQLPLADWLK
jgi:lysophospholipase L1-like esterase